MRTTNHLSTIENLMETYYRPVFRLAMRLSGSPERAMLLTQRTFRQAFERDGDLPTPGNPRNWLNAILVQEFIGGSPNLRSV